jgi:two-component sensor histidine kinase
VTALGLVVAELIANSFHHAFPDGTGTITVSLVRGKPDEKATLVFSDNALRDRLAEFSSRLRPPALYSSGVR